MSLTKRWCQDGCLSQIVLAHALRQATVWHTLSVRHAENMFDKIYKILFPADNDAMVISDSEAITVSTVGEASVTIAWDAVTDIQVMKTAIRTAYPSLVWMLSSQNAKLFFTSHALGAEDAIKRICNLPNFDSDLYYHALDGERSDPISIYRTR